MEAAGKRYILYRSRSDVIRLWHLSDLHWMSRACAEDRIREDVQTIKKDPYSFWMGGGDYCDFIGHTDKRFDPDAVAEWVSVKDLGDLGKVGMAQIRDLFKPIAHKCLGLLLGNHERHYELKTDHESLHHWLCEELDVASLEYSALLDLVLTRMPSVRVPTLTLKAPPRGCNTCQSFRLYVHHGAGYATTAGGKLNRLIQFMNSFRADIYFCGHVHDKTARKEPVIEADAACRKLREHERVGVIAGSYLKTYQQGVTTYGEQRAYRPTSLGPAVVTIKPETRKITAEV